MLRTVKNEWEETSGKSENKTQQVVQNPTGQILNSL